MFTPYSLPSIPPPPSLPIPSLLPLLPSPSPSPSPPAHLQINTTSLDPYMLQLELQDIDRDVACVAGNDARLGSLACFPRLIQLGDDTEEVSQYLALWAWRGIV